MYGCYYLIISKFTLLRKRIPAFNYSYPREKCRETLDCIICKCMRFLHNGPDSKLHSLSWLLLKDGDGMGLHFALCSCTTERGNFVIFVFGKESKCCFVFLLVLFFEGNDFNLYFSQSQPQVLEVPLIAVK